MRVGFKDTMHCCCLSLILVMTLSLSGTEGAAVVVPFPFSFSSSASGAPTPPKPAFLSRGECASNKGMLCSLKQRISNIRLSRPRCVLRFSFTCVSPCLSSPMRNDDTVNETLSNASQNTSSFGWNVTVSSVMTCVRGSTAPAACCPYPDMLDRDRGFATAATAGIGSLILSS